MSDTLGFSIKADIGEETTDLLLQENKKNLPRKTVRTRDFVRALQTASGDEQREETPLLPGDYGTKKVISTSKGEYYLLVTTPPELQTITYDDFYVEQLKFYDDDDDLLYIDEGGNHDELTDYLNERGIDGEGDIDFYKPSLVWFLHLRPLESETDNEFRVVDHRVYAKDMKILTLNDEVFRTPFGNIFENNTVCWGEVDVPPVTPQSALTYERMFFNNGFNTDLEVTYNTDIEIAGTHYSGHVLALIENQDVLKEEGEEAARDHIIQHIREHPIGRIGELWNEFIR